MPKYGVAHARSSIYTLVNLTDGMSFADTNNQKIVGSDVVLNEFVVGEEVVVVLADVYCEGPPMGGRTVYGVAGMYSIAGQGEGMVR